VFSVLLILGLAGFYYYKKVSAGQLLRMESNLLGVQARQSKLVAEKNMLEEEVRRKKHSEDELKVRDMEGGPGQPPLTPPFSP
jgi:hypothetical protein